MSEDKSKLQLIAEIAQANNKNLELIEEIERLNNGCEELEQQIDDLYKLETTLTNENERLHSIIKEVREYLDIDESIRKTCKRYDVNGIAILEILEKENI